ncbi:MAG: phosphatase PAP2 family protein [Candidatus Bruticola sp.]
MIIHNENDTNTCKIDLKKLPLPESKWLLLGLIIGLLLFDTSLFIYNLAPWIDWQLINNIIKHQHCEQLNYISFWMSWLGSGQPLVTIAVSSCLIIGLNRKWLPIFHTIATMVCTGLLNSLLKLLIMRPRPMFFGLDALVNEPYFSFPSGHTAGSSALSFAIIMATLSSSLRPIYKIIIIIWAVMYAALVAWSRLYIGVHFPSDITGAIGLAIFISCTIELIIRVAIYLVHNSNK